MAKPSIFSRDYEKKMKKRKRRILLAIILALIVGIFIFIKFQLPNMNFSEIRVKIQAWVDTGKEIPEEVEDPVEEEIPEEEEVKEPEKTYIEFAVKEGVVAKVEYVEKEGLKKIVALEPLEGYTFTLSPSQEQIIIMDEVQNIYLCKVDGTFSDITKKEYISTAGKAYPKETMTAQYQGYLWNSLPGFIDENTIVYSSQLPYFGGAATHKFLWVKNIANNTEKNLWNTKALDITIGEHVPEKGIKVTLDGTERIINGEGNFVQ